MSYCLNPDCQKPYSPHDAKFCQGCGSKLLLSDRYRALKPIGQGGFGRTFLAVDEYKPSQPRCVIKQFLPQVQTTQQADKAALLFKQEAIRLDELGKHPQIPELLAHFEQNGRQYLIQEFIDGQHLAEELAEEGPFKEIHIWQLLSDLLPVLEFIHSHQVIHRDIKPDNIIRRRGDRQLVLVDFGAARFSPSPTPAKTGTIIGSAGYAAPEQALGKAGFASDLYSLGVTCIYLLTQVEPFDLFDGPSGQWAWRHYLPQPISEPLGQILDKLLQPSVYQRFQSAAEVLQALTALTATPTPVSSSASSGTTYQQTATQTPTTPVARSFLAKLFGASPYYLKGNMLYGLGRYEEALVAFEQAVQTKPDYPEAWYRKGEVLGQLRRYPEALAAYDQVVKLKPRHAEAWCFRGMILYQMKKFDAAIASYDKALKIQPDYALVWLYYSLALKQAGSSPEALAAFDQAKQRLPESPVEQVAVLLKGWDLLLKD